MDPEDYPHAELCREIIGAAMTVLNQLGPGLREKTYERALVIELRKRGHAVDQQKQFNVFYDDSLVDTFIPDLLVDTKVVVDPKCATVFTENDVARMLAYLAITGLKLALLINFKEARLKWQRVVKSRP